MDSVSIVVKAFILTVASAVFIEKVLLDGLLRRRAKKTRRGNKKSGRR